MSRALATPAHATGTTDKVIIGRGQCSRGAFRCRAEPPNSGGKPQGEKVLPAPRLDLGGKEPDKSWNASSLAFLGDSVWELYARRRCFHPPKSTARYRDAVIQLVRAEAQAEACGRLLDSGILSEKEAEVLRWGKNAPGTLPKRLERAVYRDATSLEVLIGYLYMSGYHDRLNVIMDFLHLL
jgi:23S rRNA maturation mini-RNase III